LATGEAHTMMRVVFRFDDYSAAPWRSYEIDSQICDLFLSLDVPLVVGVTPQIAHGIRNPQNGIFYALEEDVRRIAMLREGLARGWQLALHGFTHQTNGTTTMTEFARQPAAVQLAKMKSGRALLERCFPGVPVHVFVPPWNTFDDVTVECVTELGFKVLCAGDVKPRANRTGLAVLPSYIGAWQLQGYVKHYSLDDLIRIVGNRYLVVTLHEYEFRSGNGENSVSLTEFAQTLREFVRRGIRATIFSLSVNPAQFMMSQVDVLEAKLYFMEQSCVLHRQELAGSLFRAGCRLGQVRPTWATDRAVLMIRLLDKALKYARDWPH
jgi:peptidoglycan/xylan/chitin deacetylase (PgdA/CDA1 family)